MNYKKPYDIANLPSLIYARYPCRSAYRSDPDEGQVPRGLQRPPEVGAGEGVPLQPVHHHQEKVGTRARTRTLGTTSMPLRCCCCYCCCDSCCSCCCCFNDNYVFSLLLLLWLLLLLLLYLLGLQYKWHSA